MITVAKTKKRELPAIFLLYRAAFPPSERKPFSTIVKMARSGRADLWTIWEDGHFAGFAATVNAPELVLLDYLAVSKKYRGWGIGTAAMKSLMERYPALFVEIESTLAHARNQSEREKRKQFYVNCGMKPMDTEADVFGIRMELLGFRCSLDLESYRNFYRDHYSPWAAQHIKEVQP